MPVKTFAWMGERRCEAHSTAADTLRCRESSPMLTRAERARIVGNAQQLLDDVFAAQQMSICGSSCVTSSCGANAGHDEGVSAAESPTESAECCSPFAAESRQDPIVVEVSSNCLSSTSSVDNTRADQNSSPE